MFLFRVQHCLKWFDAATDAKVVKFIDEYGVRAQKCIFAFFRILIGLSYNCKP